MDVREALLVWIVLRVLSQGLGEEVERQECDNEAVGLDEGAVAQTPSLLKPSNLKVK